MNQTTKDKVKNFFQADLRSLALFRIALSLEILSDLIQRLPDLSAFYTDQGVYPRTLAFTATCHPNSLSLHFASGSTWMQFILFLGYYLYHFICGMTT